jgi:site-specific recombinase XerD
VRWQYLAVNKATLAVAPSPAPTEPDPPSAEEAARLLNHAWADPDWGLFLWLTMLTGSRRGEMCALRWTHVDFERAILWVPRSVVQTKAGLKEKETKTKKRRRVALDPRTLSLLEEHRDRWAKQCAGLGCTLAEDAYLFSPAPDGSTPFVPRSLTQRYRRMATRLKLRSTRLHSLRHYSATELIAAGVDLRTVAGRLGHGSGGATTLKVYAAWVDEADRRAATTMAGIMPKPVPALRPPRGPHEQIAEALIDDIRPAACSRATSCPPSSNSPSPTPCRWAPHTAPWPCSAPKGSSTLGADAAPSSKLGPPRQSLVHRPQCRLILSWGATQTAPRVKEISET